MGIKHKHRSLEERRNTGVAASQRRFGVDWSDPKEVAEEVRRLDSHRAAANERIAILERELEAGRKAYAAWPAREAFILAEIPRVKARIDSLSEKRVDTLLKLGGAKRESELTKLQAKVRRLQAEIVEDKRRGGPAEKPKSKEKAPKPGAYSSGLGDPSVGDVASK